MVRLHCLSDYATGMKVAHSRPSDSGEMSIFRWRIGVVVVLVPILLTLPFCGKEADREPSLDSAVRIARLPFSTPNYAWLDGSNVLFMKAKGLKVNLWNYNAVASHGEIVMTIESTLKLSKQIKEIGVIWAVSPDRAHCVINFSSPSLANISERVVVDLKKCIVADRCITNGTPDELVWLSLRAGFAELTHSSKGTTTAIIRASSNLTSATLAELPMSEWFYARYDTNDNHLLTLNYSGNSKLVISKLRVSEKEFKPADTEVTLGMPSLHYALVDADFSPTGDALAYTAETFSRNSNSLLGRLSRFFCGPGKPESELYVFNLRQGTLHKIIAVDKGRNLYYPKWLTDGKSLSFEVDGFLYRTSIPAQRNEPDGQSIELR
jgi:hypothetical protein